MVHPILSYLGKLNRAKHHLESLDQAIFSFLQPDCYEITTEEDIEQEAVDFVKGTLRRRVIFKRELPFLEWGAMVGDVTQNLRSSLDHIIYAISYSRSPDEFREDRSTEFPICDSPSAFNRVSRRDRPAHYEIRGLPPQAQAIVERLQPYHNPNGLVADPLWILREMSNIEKHRTIHLTVWNAVALARDITAIPPGVIIHSHSVRSVGPLESGTIIAEMRFSNSNPSEVAVDMYKNFVFTVAFGEGTPLLGQPVETALPDLADCAEGILNELAQFVAR